jgi:hypothetical protein
MVLFLHAHGERAREVFFGRRPVLGEARYGLLLTIATLALGIAVLASMRTFLPFLHTVEHNPLQDLMERPRDAWLFGLVVVVAGGVREEIQRAFVLHRFEVWLGGGWVGIVVGSAASARDICYRAPTRLSRPAFSACSGGLCTCGAVRWSPPS